MELVDIMQVVAYLNNCIRYLDLTVEEIKSLTCASDVLWEQIDRGLKEKEEK